MMKVQSELKMQTAHGGIASKAKATGVNGRSKQIFDTG